MLWHSTVPFSFLWDVPALDQTNVTQLEMTHSCHRLLGLTATLEWVTLFEICFPDMIALTKQFTYPL